MASDETGRPAGDPDGMRRLARELDTAADEARLPTRDATRAVAEMTFVGPAGDSAREEARDLGARSIRLAVDLRDLADDLRRRAGVVERAQDRWERRRERERDDEETPRQPPPGPSEFGDEFTP